MVFDASPPLGRIACACMLAILAWAGNVGRAQAALPADGGALPSIGGGVGWAGEDLGVDTGQSTSIAVQADGRIVTGETAEPAATPAAHVSRRLAPGALDPSFGSGGIAQVPVGGSTDVAVRDIALDSQGRIVAVGSYATGGASGSNAFVLRLLANGTPDPAFSGDGVLEVELCAAYDDGAYAVTLLANDTILVGGFARSGCNASSGQREAAVFQVTPSGTLDPAFGTGGVVDQLPIIDTPSIVTAIATNSTGGVVIGGQRPLGNQAFLARLTPTGA
ncbi:MAG: hypothetical protein H7287_11640 [Thermoleophilia bacterium]|nr:hypothetical protein [Thermoleophilia bacterium]